MVDLYEDNLQVVKEGNVWVLYRISGDTKCAIYKDTNIKNIRKLLPYK